MSKETITPEDLQAVRLDATTQVGVVEVSEVQASATGRGLSGAPTGDTLRAAMDQDPRMEEVILPSLRARAPGARLYRWVADRRVVQLEPAEGQETHYSAEVEALGSQRSIEGVEDMPPPIVVVPPGPQRSRIRLSSQAGDVLLVCQEGRIWCAPVELPVSKELKAIGAGRSGPAPRLLPLNLSTLAADANLEPWLANAAGGLLSSKRDLKRAAGAGLVARLWSPPPSRDALARVRAVQAGPLARATQWLASSSAEARRELETQAVFEAHDLAKRFDRLETMAVADAPDTVEAAVWWLEDRDDLESVRFLLAHMKEGNALEAAVDTLDRATTPRHSVWSLVKLPPSQRLEAIALQEPDVWWGNLSVGR